jgi:hypothetical protein
MVSKLPIRSTFRATRELGQAILRAEKPAEIDRLLAAESFLKLTSPAAFKRIKLHPDG